MTSLEKLKSEKCYPFLLRNVNDATQALKHQVVRNVEKILEIEQRDKKLAESMAAHLVRLSGVGFNGAFKITDERVYHLGIGVAQSRMKRVEKSANDYFYHTYVSYGEETKSRALTEGDYFHKAILEPELLEKGFMSESQVLAGLDEETRKKARPTATKAYREALAAINKSGTNVIKNDLYNDLKTIVGTVRNHPSVKNILSNGEAEMAIYCLDKYTGIVCRIKADFMTDDGYFCDFKTCRDVMPGEFSKSIANYGYHVQAAFYCDVYFQATGKQAKDWLWVCMERVAPYAIRAYTPTDKMLDKGEEIYRKRLDAIAKCYHNNVWPGPTSKIEEIELPAWAY